MAASRDVVACITVGVGSLAPQSVFQSANRVLHFALDLISFAFAFELAVAGYLSNNFFHFPLACSAEPRMRSLSTILASKILNTVGL
jgi:hypothetical protein